jgi:hypothetical protein
MLSLGRIVLGFAVDGATQTVPMYVAELVPAALRGRLVLAAVPAFLMLLLIPTQQARQQAG